MPLSSISTLNSNLRRWSCICSFLLPAGVKLGFVNRGQRRGLQSCSKVLHILVLIPVIFFFPQNCCQLVCRRPMVLTLQPSSLPRNSLQTPFNLHQILSHLASGCLWSSTETQPHSLLLVLTLLWGKAASSMLITSLGTFFIHKGCGCPLYSSRYSDILILSREEIKKLSLLKVSIKFWLWRHKVSVTTR